MRTIKFRGYNRKNNIWLYGFYLQNRGQHFVCPDEFATGKTWDDYEIDPETLGQFTGLYDKNGIEIYEGDIVLYFTKKMQISWVDNCLRFLVVCDDFDLDLCDFRVKENAKVICNIHDNPELLTTNK